MPKIKKVEKVGKLTKIKKITVADLSFPDYDLSRDGITQSLLSNVQVCRQKFLFAINRWVKSGTERKYLFGTVIHAFLEKAYTRHIFKDVNVENAFIDEWVTNYFQEHVTGRISGLEKRGEQEIEARVYAVLTEYMKFYRDDFTEMKFVEVEKSFEIDFHGYTLKGKTDGVFQDKQNKLWVLEHKTKGRIDEDTLLLLLCFDTQSLFYVLVKQRQAKQSVAGVIYNVIRNPSQRWSTSETLKKYQDRIIKEIQLKPEHFFKRYEIPFTPQDVIKFEGHLDTVLSELQSLIQGRTPVYKNDKACDGKFVCEYLEACAKGKLTGLEQTESLFMELK